MRSRQIIGRRTGGGDHAKGVQANPSRLDQGHVALVGAGRSGDVFRRTDRRSLIRVAGFIVFNRAGTRCGQCQIACGIQRVVGDSRRKREADAGHIANQNLGDAVQFDLAIDGGKNIHPANDRQIKTDTGSEIGYDIGGVGRGQG